MANELVIAYPTGNTIYAHVIDSVGQIWRTDTSVFETPQNANYANYDIAATEAGTTEIYRASMPAADAGVYGFIFRLQAGGAPATTDISIGSGTIHWDGGAEIGLDDIPEDVWTYGTRTLTTTAAAAAAAMEGSEITIHRGDTLSVSITGMGDISGRANIWFTVKTSPEDTDAESTIMIDELTGLLYLNGAAAGIAANGSITVDDAAAGDITVTLAAAESDDLVPAANLYYDVQMDTAAGVVTTLTQNLCRITGDITRLIT